MNTLRPHPTPHPTLHPTPPSTSHHTSHPFPTPEPHLDPTPSALSETLLQAQGYPRWVGDIGGTNARFAIVASPGASPTHVAQYPGAQFGSLEAAMATYLAEHPVAPAWAALGVATAVTGDHVRLTNSPWSFSIAGLKAALGLKRLLVINDFTALALSLPALGPHDVRPVGGGQALPGAPVALLGPGTGLGVSGLLPTPSGDALVPINGEGGHVTLSTADSFEAEVLCFLRQRFEHVSAERALSGPGLENLLQAVCAVHGWPPYEFSAAEITAKAMAQSSNSSGAGACLMAVELCCSLLGTVAGNLALTLGARGGVYIGGGIVPRLGAWIDHSPFRTRFEAKGRFNAYLREIPTFVIAPSNAPALMGAARALDLM